MKFTTPYDQYKEYNSMECEIIRELDDSERDPEVGTMYKIRLNNGIIIDAWPEELYPELLA